jgi:hypothetical protein
VAVEEEKPGGRRAGGAGGGRAPTAANPGDVKKLAP